MHWHPAPALLQLCCNWLVLSFSRYPSRLVHLSSPAPACKTVVQCKLHLVHSPINALPVRPRKHARSCVPPATCVGSAELQDMGADWLAAAGGTGVPSWEQPTGVPSLAASQASSPGWCAAQLLLPSQRAIWLTRMQQLAQPVCSWQPICTQLHLPGNGTSRSQVPAPCTHAIFASSSYLLVFTTLLSVPAKSLCTG